MGAKARQFSPQDVVSLDVKVRLAFLVRVLAAATWANSQGTPKDAKAYVPWGHALKLGQRPCEQRAREPPTSQRGDAYTKGDAPPSNLGALPRMPGFVIHLEGDLVTK